MTVLFADLVGFTPFSEERDAEEIRETLSRYFEVAKDVVGRYGGTIEKFIGDAVMAVWGTPTAHEDDAERAVRAGLELVDAVRSLAPGIQARAGILTGEAAVTVGATDQAMVAGDLVNTASRLQAAAPVGSVLVGDPTYRAASNAIAFEQAGDKVLKGKQSPVPAWRALRVVAELRGRNRSERLEAPFVGRDDALRLLKDLLHATTRERRARLVSITGIAGIGKSRLAWEFEKYLDGVVETVRWHAGRSPAYGEGVTFWALGEMVRSRAGLLESDDPQTTRSRIGETIADWIPDEAERRWIESALLALLGHDEPPPGGRDALFAAWRTFFERLSARETVVMVFEDLHWADAGLLDFIDHLLEWSRDHPIYVVTLARPDLLERRPGWGAGKRDFTAIGLEPLNGSQMRALLDGLVPGLPEAAADTIIARADGVPLYAIETVRVLVAEGRLVEADGAYRPVGELGDLAVPETLQALIAARLDALDPAERSLLQDAAVLGQSFAPAALASVTGIASDALEPRLRSLVRKEVLAHKVDPRSPERGQFSFVQALIREVAYNTLARPDRKVRHLAAARWFESLGEDELAGALAAHYLAAYRNTTPGADADALAVQARLALRGAGDRAAALGSYEHALTFFEQALTVSPDGTERFELLVRAAQAATFARHHGAAEGHGRQALEIARQSGDRHSIARATSVLGRVLLNDFASRPAIELLEPADRELSDLRDDADAIALSGQLARAYFFVQDNERSLEVADRVLAAAEHADAVEVVADTLVTKGAVLCNLGRAYEGLGAMKTGQAIAEAHGFTETMFRALGNRSGYESNIDPRAGLESARAGLALQRRLGWPTNPTLVINAASAAVRLGEWDDAVELVEARVGERLDEADRARMSGMLAVLLALRGEPHDELLEWIESMAEKRFTADADIMVAIEVQATAALVDGRLDDAHALYSRFAQISGLNAGYALPLAARAAIWARDVEAARESLAAMVATGLHGPAQEADRRTITAGILGLEGRRPEALAAYRDAMRAWRDLGAAFDEALAGIDMVSVLGPDEPDARASGERAREILFALRSRPLVERLDGLLVASNRPPIVSHDVAAETVPGSPASAGAVPGA